MFGLKLVFSRQVSPKVCNDFSEIDTRNLADVLLGVGSHQNKEVFKSLNFLKVLFKDGGCFLDYIGIWLEKVAE